MQINKINTNPLEYNHSFEKNKKSNIPVNANDNDHLRNLLNKTNYNTANAIRGAALAAILSGTALSAAACGDSYKERMANAPEDTTNVPETVQSPEDSSIETTQDELDRLGDEIDTMTSLSGKTELADVHSAAMPVTEFYFTNADGEAVLTPDKNIKTNEAGSVIVTITETPSDDDTEGNTLSEIIEKVYADSLAGYEGEERITVKNKIIDEIIQSNPSLSEYIKAELGEDAKNYTVIGNMDLYNGVSSKDEALDSRMLIMPETIVYQIQGKEPENTVFFSSSDTYRPNSESASVINTDDAELMENEYKSFSDLIYGSYGEDISDEAYRDIVYAVVNAPQNADEFENIIDNMNFYEILETANINDLNRTLDENMDDIMLGLYLPTVSTLRIQANNADINTKVTDGIVYQLSPGYTSFGFNDRVIALTDNTSPDGTMAPGSVFKLEDVLQYYSSPDGNGRFANVVDGKLVINDKVNYGDQFAQSILQQVVYANLDIFASKYEDQNGIYYYGIFDVDPDFDTTDKSLEEILSHSKIDVDRMMSYSFVDKNGELRFNDGVELKLPQFNYRINNCDTLKACECSDDDKCNCKPTVPPCTCPEDKNPEDPGCNCPEEEPEIMPDEPEPTVPEKSEIVNDEPEPTVPEKTQPTTPTDTQPTFPTDTQPTFPTDTQPTTPTDTEPTIPTDTEPTIPTDTEPTIPTDTEPTIPTDTEPTTPTDTEPTIPTDTQPTIPTETEPTEPTDKETEPTLDPTDIEPTDPTDTEPTTPTDTEPTIPTDTTPSNPTGEDIPPENPTETEPTIPTDTEPTTPTDTEPTTPTDTEPTTPTDTEPTIPTGTEPTNPTGEDIPPENPTETAPSVPTDTEPTTPSDTEPSTPSDTEPSTPSDTEPTTPSDTEPTTPSDTEPSDCPDEPTESTDKEEEPGLDDEEPNPSEPSESEPSTPSESEPSTPSESEPSTPSDTESSDCPEEPTEPTDKEEEPGLDDIDSGVEITSNVDQGKIISNISNVDNESKPKSMLERVGSFLIEKLAVKNNKSNGLNYKA